MISIIEDFNQKNVLITSWTRKLLFLYPHAKFCGGI